jgi:hypothetical protein
MNRRKFLKTSASGALMTALPARLRSNQIPKNPAQSCIFIWLGGGNAQVDTWDPKALGDPLQRIAGSAYPAIDTAVEGVQVCEHLHRTAARLDRMTLVRSVHHEVINEHAAAVNFMHTGRPVSGTVVYPSIGAIVNHELGAAEIGMPGYVVCGPPSNSRGAGFLGAKYGYLYVTDTARGPVGFTRPPTVSEARDLRRQKMLKSMRNEIVQTIPVEDPLLQYETVMDTSLQMSRGGFSKVFQLDQEADSLRQTYGGEFGHRCLLARRLVQRGTRFIEVLHNLNFKNGTGWDTHREGQQGQHLLIQELDTALAALVDDLENHKLLDSTLIVVAGEFGRPSSFDVAGGRGHQGSAFSVALAGGGLNHCGAYGTTDDLSKKILEDPVSVPDLHATIYQALGIESSKKLFHNDRPIPITNDGRPITALIS